MFHIPFEVETQEESTELSSSGPDVPSSIIKALASNSLQSIM